MKFVFQIILKLTFATASQDKIQDLNRVFWIDSPTKTVRIMIKDRHRMCMRCNADATHTHALSVIQFTFIFYRCSASHESIIEIHS